MKRSYSPNYLAESDIKRVNMWKKTLLALCLAGHCAFAADTEYKEGRIFSENGLKQLKDDWVKIYQKEMLVAEHNRLKQRENFQQIGYLTNSAIAQKKLSSASEQIIQNLLATLSGYPLEMDADWALLNTKIVLKQADLDDINSFVKKYPNSAYQKQLQQTRFELLYKEQKFAELIEYAKEVKPTNLANQCLLFSARYETFADKQQINPEAGTLNSGNGELTVLVKEFDEFWLENPKLTSDCANLESYWRDLGLKTDEKVRLKAVKAVKQNVNAEIDNLALNATTEKLKNWLVNLSSVAKNPNDLPKFVESQLIESEFMAENKKILLEIFPKYIRTLPENLGNPSFELYQKWGEYFRLTNEEINTLRVSFINRFFDNREPTFQFWRDEQIKAVKADNLTERRLRMAIWQKSDLHEWLDLLSDESKAKAEWRYWSAKVNKNKSERGEIWKTLSEERGFYPMLAAQQLGKAYQLPATAKVELSEEQRNTYYNDLERIAELRKLGRMNQAKTAWIAFLKNLPFEVKLAVISYAKEQDWYDLTVEGTIQAKAFDHIELRLPNAYSDLFDLHLKDKVISKTFAQAIARQESAWNPEAKSHANAIGLMQMLPTTAKKTATDNALVFRDESDLLKPFNNIMLGTAHLAELNEKYPNNRILIAAAYNAGAGRVEQWLKRSNKQLEMDEFIASIPFYETRGYVQNVLAYDYYYQNLYHIGDQKKNELKMFYQEELRQKY